MGFLERFKNPLVLLALVLAQTLFLATEVQRPLPGSLPGSLAARLATDNHDGTHGQVTLLRTWAAAATTPFERVAQGLSAGTHRLWSNYIDLRHAREQATTLRMEVDRLRLEQAALTEDAAEGRRLQALLGFKEHYISKTVAAQVIGTGGSDRSHVLWLDKGSADGLRPEQPVITPEGVVGKLRDVGAHTSQLLLLSDSSSGAGVVLVSTRLRAVLRGTAAGELEITNLTADERIKPGESVVTSGGDQVFPRGLPVGSVLSVAPDPKHPPYTVIRLRPAANLRRLEEVLIVTGVSGALPPEAAADLAQSEATGRANERAADLVAARLPSLHDDSPAAPPSPATTPGSSPKTAASGDAAPSDNGKPAPRVKPALHADRFSAGSTPSATQLQPGAPR